MHNWGIPVAGANRGRSAPRRRTCAGAGGLPTEVPPPALALDVCPPSYQENSNLPHPKYQPPPHRQWMRYVPYNGSTPAPHWTRKKPGGTRVCVVGGGSLSMWKHYFHCGFIFGLDIYDKFEFDQPASSPSSATRTRRSSVRTLLRRPG